MIKTLKFYIKIIINHFFFLKKSYGYNIKIFNYQWDKTYYVPNHWLFKYINNKCIIPKNKTLSIYSLNGQRLSLKLDKCDIRIFYTVENVHVPLSHWAKYDDLLLNDPKTKLSLGFDYLDHHKYLRFPYWLMTTFGYNETVESISKKCFEFENIKHLERIKFCAFICRQDYFGDRTKFADLIETIAPINYPGNFRHNDVSLKKEYNDDKIEYLKQFKFNLCPENSDAKGYVTEKIFDAIKAGCIPIYWGSENCPEPDVLNQNRILFLSLDGDNTEVLNKIKLLNENENAYNEFYNQPILTTNAPEVIYGYLDRLEKKIREIIK